MTPIRLDLDRGVRSGSITVSNDDNAPLTLQMALQEWNQDTEGRDQYRDSRDLVVFPRVAVLAAGENRLVRTAIKVPARDKEKTYRLFVEEVPPNTKKGGAQVNVAVRFGIPVFVRPEVPKTTGEISSLDLQGGRLRLRVTNTGNMHFFIRSIQAGDGDAYHQELAGWYLLAGASREYELELPPDVCRRLNKLEVSVQSEAFPSPIRQDFEPGPGACD